MRYPQFASHSHILAPTKTNDHLYFKLRNIGSGVLISGARGSHRNVWLVEYVWTGDRLRRKKLWVSSPTEKHSHYCWPWQLNPWHLAWSFITDSGFPPDHSSTKSVLGLLTASHEVAFGENVGDFARIKTNYLWQDYYWSWLPMMSMRERFTCTLLLAGSN